jgi:hypothetical protein
VKLLRFCEPDMGGITEKKKRDRHIGGLCILVLCKESGIFLARSIML